MVNDNKDLKRLCKEYWLIENYDEAVNDKDNIWVCHHRREVQDGFRIWKKEELIKIGQYYDREPNELIFMKRSEHIPLHNKAIDPKTKKPCSVRNTKGNKNGMYGKKGANLGKKFSIETCNKLSNSKSPDWINNYGYTRRELEKLLPLTSAQIRYMHITNKEKLKQVIKITLGG